MLYFAVVAHFIDPLSPVLITFQVCQSRVLTFREMIRTIGEKVEMKWRVCGQSCLLRHLRTYN